MSIDTDRLTNCAITFNLTSDTTASLQTSIRFLHPLMRVTLSNRMKAVEL